MWGAVGRMTWCSPANPGTGEALIPQASRRRRGPYEFLGHPFQELRMKPMMLAVVGAGALFAAGAAGQDKGKTDEEKIQGTWSIASLERGGFEVMEDFVKEAKVVITADKV